MFLIIIIINYNYNTNDNNSTNTNDNNNTNTNNTNNQMLASCSHNPVETFQEVFYFDGCPSARNVRWSAQCVSWPRTTVPIISLPCCLAFFILFIHIEILDVRIQF